MGASSGHREGWRSHSGGLRGSSWGFQESSWRIQEPTGRVYASNTVPSGAPLHRGAGKPFPETKKGCGFPQPFAILWWSGGGSNP